MHSAMNSATKALPKSETRIPKPPKPPEKPLMPYMRYSRKVWERVKNENPQLKLWEVGRIIGQMWRELPDEEKNAYIEEYEAEKLPYSEAMRQYHSSPAYQAWIVAKERAEKGGDDAEMDRKNQARSRDKQEVPLIDLRESYILEDNEEDPDEQFTVKHVAAARFQRNHRLMQEILSDAKLPDPGQLITKTRLYTLRMQVKQLKNHKKNLCSEIENCELRHQAKMRRIADESAAFYADYRKLVAAKPRITEAQFSEMIIKAKHDLVREEEEKRELQLLEAENRRRRQQQRQQREAELADAERRRQMQHQAQQQAQQQTSQQPLPAQSPHLQQQPNQLKQGDFSKKAQEAASPALADPNDSSQPPNITEPQMHSAFPGRPPATCGVGSHMSQPTAKMSHPQPVQSPQQNYPPNQQLQRPVEELSDNRLPPYRSQPMNGTPSSYGPQVHPPNCSYSPAGPQPSPTMSSSQPSYPPPPHYPSMPTSVVGHPQVAQPPSSQLTQAPSVPPTPQSAIQSSQPPESQCVPGYPSEPSNFYSSPKPPVSSEFSPMSSKREAASDRNMDSMEGQGTPAPAKKKKKSASSQGNKDKKPGQPELQRSTVPTMGLDQPMSSGQMGSVEMAVSDRGSKTPGSKYAQGYFDDLQRQGSPVLMQNPNAHFQQQQQQQPPPPPLPQQQSEYHHVQPGMQSDSRMAMGGSYGPNPAYYSPSSQGFPSQPRQYPAHPGMYGGPPSNYPSQQTPPPAYHHNPPPQPSPNMPPGQQAMPSQHPGQMNWSMQQQQQQPSQQPGSGYSPQYPGHPSMMRYPMASGMGYQSRPMYPGQQHPAQSQQQQQPGAQEGPQHQPAPAPPPYQQVAMQQNYWPPQQGQPPPPPQHHQQSPMPPGHMMSQGGVAMAQYQDRQRIPGPLTEGPMRGAQQAGPGPMMGPASQNSSGVPGHKHPSMMGSYYQAYGSSQVGYCGQQAPGGMPATTYFGGPPQQTHMNYSGASGAGGGSGTYMPQGVGQPPANMWSGYPPSPQQQQQHQMQPSAAAAYFSQQQPPPMGHPGQQQRSMMMSGGRSVPTGGPQQQQQQQQPSQPPQAAPPPQGQVAPTSQPPPSSTTSSAGSKEEAAPPPMQRPPSASSGTGGGGGGGQTVSGMPTASGGGGGM